MLGLWEYFWTEAEWVPPVGGGPKVGSLALLGAGRVILITFLTKEMVSWILN